MKKLLFILTLFISLVAAAQPGPVNSYKTRVRYWLEMADSLQGAPRDTFNLRTPWAIQNQWNNFPWVATKGDSLYMWSIAQQRWLVANKQQLPSTVTIINDSSIRICDANGVCDTFIANISPPVVTNVSVINDSTILICTGNNSCDTVITHITVNPPITSTTIINDSTLLICNANGCDTFIVTTTVNPPLTTTTIINDSTIIVCNANGCDTLVIHTVINPAITTTTILNDSTMIVCNTNGCDTFIVHTIVNPPITSTTILNDSTIIVCNTNGCDTLVINSVAPPIISTTILNDTTIIVCNNSSCDTIVINPPITITTVFNDTTIIICTNTGCDTIVLNPPINTTTIINDSTIIVCSNTGCDTLVIHPPITTTTILTDTSIIVCTPLGCDTLVIHPPITTTTILNDSTIIICGTNSCDTVVFHSAITNVTILNDTTIQVCGSNVVGVEQIINGGFIGNANGWELGSLWAYGSNNIVHSFGSAQPTAQAGALVEGGTYVVSANVGGTTGTLDIKLDAGTTQTYAGGAGPVTFTGTWSSANNYKIVLTPSTDFDGTVTNVSVRQILPNCDTLQIPPTIFVPNDTFYVERTLYSTGVGVTDHDTVYSSLASRVDSGHLSIADWIYHNHKADTLYYHPSPAGQDSFLYDNDLQTGILWYVNDVNANGLISGGQVLPSGTPYVFNVTPAVYRINGIRYTSPATQITVPTADPSLPRTDRFVVDTSGNAALITGIAANPNLAPSFDVAWQLSLTTIDLPAANPPTITDSTIWNENVVPEWIPVTNQATTTNPNNTVFPWIGLKSIDVTNVHAGSVVIFTHTGTFDLTPFVVANGSLTGFIKLKQAIPATAHLAAQFFNGGTNVSPLVTIPLVANNITTYQGFSIPLSSFALTNNFVTILRIQYVASNNTNNSGYWLDDINLQSGIQPPVSQSNALILVSRRPGTDSVMGTYQNGAISYQFKDSSGAAPTLQTLQQTFNTEIGGSRLTKIDTIMLKNDQESLRIIDSSNAGPASFQILERGSGGGQALSIIGSTTGTTATIATISTQANQGALQLTTNSNTSSATLSISNTQSGNTSNSAVMINNSAPVPTNPYQGNAGLYVSSIHSIAIQSVVDSAATSSTVPNIVLNRTATALTPANGIGQSIDFYTVTATTVERFANSIISKLTDATDATRTSQLSITGVNNAVTNTLLTLSGSGAAQLNKYVSNAFTGTATNSLQVDASGNIIMGAVGGGAGGLQTLQQTFNTEVGGSVLTKNDSIALSGHGLVFFGNVTGTTPFYVANTNVSGTGFATINGSALGTGTGSQGTTEAGVGISGGASTSGTGVQGNSTSGKGGEFFSNSGVGANIYINPSSTNTVATIATFQRVSSGSTTDGVGGSIDLYTEATDGNSYLSSQLISKLTTATVGTRTSQLDITGVNSAATQTIMSAYGTGVVGIGISTGYTSTRLNVVDNGLAASGKMVEFKSTASSANATLLSVISVGLTAAIVATSVDQDAITASTTTATALRGTSSSGLSLSAASTTGLAASFSINPASTNSIVEVAQFSRSTTGTAANGVGASVGIYVEDSGNSGQLAGALTAKWLDVTTGTRTSEVSLRAVNSTATQTILRAGSPGYLVLTPITATVASALTAEEGMVVMVSNTNGTFTSIGFWGYQNGAWHAF